MEKYLEELEGAYIRKIQELKEINEYLYLNPELGREEYKACKKYSDILKRHGFLVETNFCEIETAFLGKYISNKKGPKIALLCEYDALPEIGHGCGHNILGVTSLGAGLILKEYIEELGGELYIIGTPAEETNGAKVDMVEKGVFKDMDAAIIVHPTGECHKKSGTSQAMETLRFRFKGKTAHAASQPHEGINALDGVLCLFNSINALRQQIISTARIHGIISDGGKAANIIPDFAEAKFYVRATELSYLKELVEKVKNCAKGASIATGTELEIDNYEYGFANLVTNNKLSEIYMKNLQILGVKNIGEASGMGSTDAGNVSHCCPTIHPYFPISDNPIIGHSTEFAKASISDKAYKGMKEAILAISLTGLELIINKESLQSIKDEFHKK